jgi:thioredoxin-like negative regulator of GroEL
MTTLVNITSQEEFDKQVLESVEPVVVHFWAAWCDLCEDMDKFCLLLGQKFANVKFVKVDAEALSNITEKYEIAAVPAFLFLNNRGTVSGKLEGANPPQLAQNVEALSKTQALSESKIAATDSKVTTIA